MAGVAQRSIWGRASTGNSPPRAALPFLVNQVNFTDLMVVSPSAHEDVHIWLDMI